MFQSTMRVRFKLGLVAAVASLLCGAQPAQAQGSEPYVGQLLFVGFSFTPAGWNACDGSTLSIASNDVLFTLIGTTYGGDGVNTFKVPDMRGRIPIHQGSNGSVSYTIGQIGGAETHTLLAANLPAHTHSLSMSGAVSASSALATLTTPSGHAPGGTGRSSGYSTSAPNVSLGPLTLSGSTNAATGSDLPINTMPPYLAVNCIISLFGVFPSQN